VRIFLAGEDHVLAVVRAWARARAKGTEMRIHLADAGQDVTTLKRLRTSMMAGHPWRLTSYFYCRQSPGVRDLLRVMGDGPESLIMDSGVYSFMFGSEQGTLDPTYEAYRDYTRRYLDDLAKWEYDGLVVEVDAQRMLGVDAVNRLREEFEPLGDRVMYVWHEPEGIDGLLKLARERSYIGLGLPELRHIAESKFKRVKGSKHKVSKLMAMDLLRRIHKECGDQPPRIHLLGCTVEDLMETTLAWTCDSTSWLSGIRYGQGYIYVPGEGLTQAHIRSDRFVAYRNQAADGEPELKAFLAKEKNPEYYLNCFACAHAFAQYQRWLDSRYQHVPMRGDQLPGGPMKE